MFGLLRVQVRVSLNLRGPVKLFNVYFLAVRKILKPAEFQTFKLKEKKVLSHNTAVLVQSCF